MTHKSPRRVAALIVAILVLIAASGATAWWLAGKRGLERDEAETAARRSDAAAAQAKDTAQSALSLLDRLCQDGDTQACEITAKIRALPAAPPRDGAAGRPGAAGLDGRDGIDGAPGRPGAAGQDGATGPQGLPGATGAKGEAGPAGRDGKDGADGKPGADGAPGAPGQPGADGAPGRFTPGVYACADDEISRGWVIADDGITITPLCSPLPTFPPDPTPGGPQ